MDSKLGLLPKKLKKCFLNWFLWGRMDTNELTEREHEKLDAIIHGTDADDEVADQ